MQRKDITLKAFSFVQINFGRMALILCLVIYMLHVGGGQFQGMDEDMMKKMGDLYGFPYGGPGQQIPGQVPGVPDENAQPGQGQGSERQGQGGQNPTNQGQWNGQGWPDQGDTSWPGSNQGQGQEQPWGNQGNSWPGEGGQEWPNQGQAPDSQQPGSVPGGRPEDKQTGGGRPQGPGGGAVNTAPAGQKQPDSSYDVDHSSRAVDKHHQHGSLDESHPRAPKPKHDYVVKLFNGSIHSRSVSFNDTWEGPIIYSF